MGRILVNSNDQHVNQLNAAKFLPIYVCNHLKTPSSTLHFRQTKRKIISFKRIIPRRLKISISTNARAPEFLKWGKRHWAISSVLSELSRIDGGEKISAIQREREAISGEGPIEKGQRGIFRRANLVPSRRETWTLSLVARASLFYMTPARVISLSLMC